jgi:hypothetical protein
MENSATTVFPVGRDLADGALLVVSQMPGKAVLQFRRQLALDLERDAAALPLGQDPGPNKHELEIQELVESEPSAASLCLVH